MRFCKCCAPCRCYFERCCTVCLCHCGGPFVCWGHLPVWSREGNLKKFKPLLFHSLPVCFAHHDRFDDDEKKHDKIVSLRCCACWTYHQRCCRLRRHEGRNHRDSQGTQHGGNGCQQLLRQRQPEHRQGRVLQSKDVSQATEDLDHVHFLHPQRVMLLLIPAYAPTPALIRLTSKSDVAPHTLPWSMRSVPSPSKSSLKSRPAQHSVGETLLSPHHWLRAVSHLISVE